MYVYTSPELLSLESRPVSLVIGRGQRNFPGAPRLSRSLRKLPVGLDALAVSPAVARRTCGVSLVIQSASFALARGVMNSFRSALGGLWFRPLARHAWVICSLVAAKCTLRCIYHQGCYCTFRGVTLISRPYDEIQITPNRSLPSTSSVMVSAPPEASSAGRRLMPRLTPVPLRVCDSVEPVFNRT